MPRRSRIARPDAETLRRHGLSRLIVLMRDKRNAAAGEAAA